MTKPLTDEEATAELERIRRLPWSAVFHKTLENPTAPRGKVDMYVLLDDDTGESLVSLAVPWGGRLIAEYIAACCADPYFVRTRPVDDTTLATAFNRAIGGIAVKDGQVDAREVFTAACTVIDAYVGQMPARSRAEMIDNLMSMLSE